MTVITPKSVEKRKVSYPAVTIRRDGLYFNAASITQFDLSPGNTIQFLNEGKFWAFIKIIDSDTFTLVPRKKVAGLWLYNYGLSKRILSSMNIEPNGEPIRMGLKVSSIEFKGVETIEIIPTARAKKT
jgi:hypothetical protein